MKVLIRGGGFVNKGAEAMVLTVQAELSQRLGDVTCCLEMRDAPPEGHLVNRHPGLEALRPLAMSRGEKVTALLRLIAAHPSHARDMVVRRAHWMRAQRALDIVDAVVDVSGYSYGDAWGPGQARFAYCYALLGQGRGKPYMCMPQAWGPYERAADRPAYRRLCEASSLLMARDEVSRGYLADLLGRVATAIDVCPDIAFKFSGGEEDEGKRFLAKLGLESSAAPVVGVAPNMRVYERATGTGLENGYVRVLVDICRTLRERGMSVVLIPHEIEGSGQGTTDDRLLCSMIRGAVDDPCVVAMTDACDATEIKAVVRGLHLLVGSRFHTIIAALSSCVPVVALGWSHKYEELLRSFDMESLVYDHGRLDAGGVRQLVDEILEQREALHQRLTELVPATKASVDALFDRIAALIEKKAN